MWLIIKQDIDVVYTIWNPEGDITLFVLKVSLNSNKSTDECKRSDPFLRSQQEKTNKQSASGCPSHQNKILH